MKQTQTLGLLGDALWRIFVAFASLVLPGIGFLYSKKYISAGLFTLLHSAFWVAALNLAGDKHLSLTYAYLAWGASFVLCLGASILSGFILPIARASTSWRIGVSIFGMGMSIIWFRGVQAAAKYNLGMGIGHSMEGTMKSGTFFIYSKNAEVKYDELVILDSSFLRSSPMRYRRVPKLLLKRIVGLPLDQCTVTSVQTSILRRDGDLKTFNYARKGFENKSYTLAVDSCFVLGDNLEASTDSRSFGPVPLAMLKGRYVRDVFR